MKKAYIGGGTGFIGHHMARRLKSEGYWVRVVDIKRYEYGPYDFCDEFMEADMRDVSALEWSLHLEDGQFDEVYNFACQMGGAGYVFTGENDFDIMNDSALININLSKLLVDMKFKGKVFYSSSACVYPEELQKDQYNTGLSESDAWPAHPDSKYGIEKLFSEELYLSAMRNKGLDMRIARFHNIYGPEGTYQGGREKAPAAMCRKAILSKEDLRVWGPGIQTRSFLYIDDCIDAVRLFMQSDFPGPLNIGSEEMVTINHLAELAIEFSGKDLKIKHEAGPVGVMGRNSDNTLIREKLGWEPKYKLREGLKITFDWIASRYWYKDKECKIVGNESA